MNPSEGNVHVSHVPVPDLVLACFLLSQSQGKSALALSAAFTRIQIALSLMSQAFFIFFTFSPHICPFSCSLL